MPGIVEGMSIMKIAQGLRLGSAAAAAFALLAASGASAQKENWAYCGDYARNVCSRDEMGRPITLTPECYQREFQACVTSFASNAAKKVGAYDNRLAQAAARPAGHG